MILLIPFFFLAGNLLHVQQQLTEGRMEQHAEAGDTGAGLPSLGRPAIASLQPKGSCWYCDTPVDNVRRFCSPTCRNDYLEEEAGYFGVPQHRPPAPA